MECIEFQSTLPREERRYNRCAQRVFFISIHAPTRGATTALSRQLYHHQYFNPRSHERSDKPDSIGDFGKTEFQSTLPREERQDCSECVSYSSCISIHAPTRGATHAVYNIFNNPHISIHAPTRGATHSHLA